MAFKNQWTITGKCCNGVLLEGGTASFYERWVHEGFLANSISVTHDALPWSAELLADYRAAVLGGLSGGGWGTLWTASSLGATQQGILQTWIEEGHTLVLNVEYRHIRSSLPSGPITQTIVAQSAIDAANAFLAGIGSSISITGRDYVSGVTGAAFVAPDDSYVLTSGLTQLWQAAWSPLSGGTTLCELTGAGAGFDGVIIAAENLGGGCLVVVADSQILQGDNNPAWPDDNPGYADHAEFWRRIVKVSPSALLDAA